MAENGGKSGFLAELLDWRSRRFRIGAMALLILAVGMLVWIAIPKYESSTAWGGEVICASYWGLGWYDEPGLLGRNYFKLSGRNADGTEEVVVDYNHGSDWHEYCWYRNGRLWETGRMQVGSGWWPYDGKRPPRITRWGLDNRVSQDSN